MKQQLLFIALLFIAISTNAQIAISPAGGEGKGTGGTSSFTLGQVFYTYSSSNATYVSQGVQQGIQWIYYPSSTKSFSGILPFTKVIDESGAFTASVYPNPASDHVVLVLNNLIIKDLHYVIIDLTGRAVATGIIQQKQSTILFPSLTRGTYILSVYQHTRELKNFTIIKE